MLGDMLLVWHRIWTESPYACEHGVLGEEGPPRFRGYGALGEGSYAPLEGGPLRLRGLA